MPFLVKNIQGNVLDFFEGEVKLFKSITGVVGLEDYIELNKFVALTQNFSKVIAVEEQQVLINYGLKHNLNTIELEISY